MRKILNIMSVNRPFVFGKSVDADHFIGRLDECERIRQNFTHGVNTILISPRRWGKTSIVKKISQEIYSQDLRVIFLDIFSCRDEYDFYNKFAEGVLRQTESHIEEWKHIAENFLTRLTPKISYSLDGMNEYSVSLGITPKTHQPDEILQLPEIIAQKKKCHILVCIDEFQQIGEFANSLTIQKRMRSVWQHQQNVSYCFLGSKKHMMSALFLKRSYPFYKFGDIIPIQPIPVETWIPYIQRGFASEGKSIAPPLVDMICQLVHHNPSYIQQLAWLTLIRTPKVADEKIIRLALQDLIEENAPLFTEQTQRLTSYQVNFLKALADGVNTDFGNADIRERYKLGSYSNIARIKKALEERELITMEADGVFFADYVQQQWFVQNY